MLRVCMWTLFGILMGMVTSTSINADDEKKEHKVFQRIVIGDGDLFMIPEVSAAVMADSGKLVVRAMPPAERQPKGAAKVDLKVGDEILMVNGKRVNTAEELKKLHEALAVGDEMSLGIKRDGAMHIASFKKADPASLPNRRMVVSTKGADGETMSKSPNTKVIRLDGGQNVEAIAEAGMIVGEKDGKVVVVGTLPDADAIYKVEKIKDGDVIVSLQGTSVSKVKDFTSTYKAIKVGDAVALVVNREGKTVKVSFDKPVETNETFLQK